MLPQPNVLRKVLVALDALVGLLFGVGSLMDHEIFHLPEALGAGAAREGLFVRVYPLVDLEVVVARHGLSALVAYDLDPGVNLLVDVDRVLPVAGVVARVAGVLLGPALGIVNGRVQVQASLVGVARLADLADVGLFPGVADNVPLEDGFRSEALVAGVAPDLVVVDVVPLVLLYVVHGGGREAAVPALVGAVLVLALDVVLATVLRAEELLTTLAAIGYPVLTASGVVAGHVDDAELYGCEDLVALAALEETLQRAGLGAHQEAAYRLGASRGSLVVVVVPEVVLRRAGTLRRHRVLYEVRVDLVLVDGVGAYLLFRHVVRVTTCFFQLKLRFECTRLLVFGSAQSSKRLTSFFRALFEVIYRSLNLGFF